MASSLLDELPCLLDEVDELMARLAFFMKLVTKPPSRHTTTTSNTATASCPSREALENGLSVPKLRACLSSSEAESALKFFAKQFLTSQPVPVEKMHAQLALQPPQLSQNQYPDAKRQKQKQGQNQYPDAKNALLFVAKKVFHLMKRLHHWQRAAWGILTQFFAESAYLAFDKHRLLTALLLNTLTKYVKVHLLWTSCHAIPSLLSVHTFSQYLAKPGLCGSGSPGLSATGGPMDPSASMYSPLDHVDHHLREYVLCFGSNPLFKIQQDFQQHPDGGEIARNLSALAISCFESFIGCHDLEQLRNQGCFDIESFFHGSYAALGVYEDLLYSHEQEEWVICVALCLPQQLRSSSFRNGAFGNSSSVQLWDFVHVIAQDRLVLPVFRDLCINLHTLLYQQIASMLSGVSLVSTQSASSTLPSSSSSSAGQTSLKKLMSALSKQALRTCGEQHAQRSQFAKWLLQSCTHLLTQNAALVAPLFPVLLGACRIARDEIEWLLCHEDQHHLLLPAHVKPKHLVQNQSSFTGSAGICGDLLALTHRLRALVQQNAGFVKGYFEEFLTCGDADAIAFEIQELLDNNANSDSQSGESPSRQQPVNPQILRSFAVKERYRPVSGASNTGSGGTQYQAKASPWRREWRQLSVVLLSSSSNTQELPKSLLERMERACSHSKYVESATGLLDFHAQLSKWWWFASQFERMHQQLLVLSGGTGAQAAIAMLEIVDATICAAYTLDEIVEEAEAQEQAILMQELYQRMENGVGVQLERAVDSVVIQEAALLTTSGSRLNQQHFSSNSVDHLQGNKIEKSHRESRAAAVASSLSLSSLNNSGVKNSEFRFPSAIASMRGSSGKAKLGGSLQAPRGGGAGALGSLAKADEALFKLASALHTHTASNTEAARNRTSRLANLVEHHVRVSLVRFLRGLVEFSDLGSNNNSNSSSMTATFVGSSPFACTLRCSLQHAALELQCYINCVQKLFHNTLFVDLTHVVLDTLACESQMMPGGGREAGAASTLRTTFAAQSAKLPDALQWTMMQRMTWFYTSMLLGKCAPLASSSSTNSLIASRRKQSFVFFQRNTQAQSVEKTMILPEQFTNPNALRSLRGIIGSKGIKALGAAITGCVCTQVQALRQTLEQDQIALIRFDKSMDAPHSELAMAVKQMARLEDFGVQLVQIGLHLFFAELLEHVEPSFLIRRDPQWQQMLDTEREGGPRSSGGSSDVVDRPHAKIWRLLPVAFAASFHSELWRRTKHLDLLDATDTNAHVSCTAMLHLLQVVHDPLPVKLSSVPMPSDSSVNEEVDNDGGVSENVGQHLRPSQQQHRALFRRVVELSSQSVLGLRTAAPRELPTPAMLAAVRLFAEMAGTSEGDRGELLEAETQSLEVGILDQCLPDIVFQTCTARVG